MKYIRLSHIITEKTPSYGNRDRVIIRTNSSIQKGESSNSSCWIFSNNHIGTHIDTPYHFSEKRKKMCDLSIDEFFFDKVVVVDIPYNDGFLINPKDFKNKNIILPKDTQLLLIRTGYEQFRHNDKYWNDNPGLAPELADYLRHICPKLRCVGFDFISLTSWNFRKEGRDSHKAFLCPGDGGREILVIEDMALSHIQNPVNKVIVAPLFVEDGNGGAVTAFAELDLEVSS